MKRLLPETEKKLCNFIEEVACAEKKIEECRQLLAELPDFEPYSAFLRIDQKRVKYVSAEDIFKFLKYLFSVHVGRIILK